MLAAMLTHVFDPPPDHLTIPGPTSPLLGATALVACLGAAALVSLQIRRLPLGALLRE